MNYNKLVKEIWGLEIKKILGTGSFGKVYKTDNENLVVKITNHLDEAYTIKNIMNLRKSDKNLFPSVVKLGGIYKIKNNPKNHYESEYSYLILREYVKIYKGNSIPEYFENPSEYTYNWKKIYVSQINLLKTFDKILYITLKELIENDIYLWDIRKKNVGLSIGNAPRRPENSLVIFDVVSINPERTEIEMIGKENDKKIANDFIY